MELYLSVLKIFNNIINFFNIFMNETTYHRLQNKYKKIDINGLDLI